jgi:hypothetical protein
VVHILTCILTHTQAVITPCTPSLATPSQAPRATTPTTPPASTSSLAQAPTRWFLGACATHSGVAATPSSPTDELSHWGFFPGHLDEVRVALATQTTLSHPLTHPSVHAQARVSHVV